MYGQIRMLNQIERKVASFARREGLEKHFILCRSLHARDRSGTPTVEAEFCYRDRRFALAFTPRKNGRYAVDFVERRELNAPFPPLLTEQESTRLVTFQPIDRALKKVKAHLPKYLAIIDEALGDDLALPEGFPEPRPDLPSKKVGICTLPLNRNFGGNLQAVAMIKALQLLGHEAVLVRRMLPTRKMRQNPDQAALSDDTPLMSPSIDVERVAFNRNFLERHINRFTRPFYTSEQISKHISRYNFDALVVGSDQTWRPKYAKSLLDDFFFRSLPNEPPRPRRIAYAPSFGVENWEYTAPQTKRATQALQLFDAVSVREDNGVALCRDNLGAEAKHVLDPTMLLSPAYYEKMISCLKPLAKKQITVYVLDADDDKTRLIQTVEQSLGLQACATDGQPYRAGDPLTGLREAPVETWLRAIHDAEFVIADSFHGIVFSILFNRPFLAYVNQERGSARFASLLKMFGLEDRMIFDATTADPDMLLQPIDWDAVNARLVELRRESVEFLQAAIYGPDWFTVEKKSANLTPASKAFPILETPALSGVAPALQTFCTGCGACASEPGSGLEMAWSKDGFLIPIATADTDTERTLRVCPFNPAPAPEVQDEDALAELFLPDADQYAPQAGKYLNCYIGYSNAYRATSSSGGIATYVFDKLLKLGKVDYLFTVTGDEKNGFEYHLTDGSGDITRISQTRYFPVTLAQLYETIEQIPGRVAVSGVACFIKSIRLKQHYHPELREKIPFLVGIVCGGLKSSMYTDFLAQSAGIKAGYSQPNYRVKDPESSATDYSFQAWDNNGRPKQVRMATLGDMWGSGLFKSRACDFCTDVLTELADISLGDAWLPRYRRDGMGNSIIVTRSKLADEIIRTGIENKELTVQSADVEKMVRSQGGGSTTSIKAFSSAVTSRARVPMNHCLRSARVFSKP
jgi:coenzyme F420-reducing hydrogenase beta subunit